AIVSSTWFLQITDEFRAFESDYIRLPPRSPNLSAFAERFVRSIKEQCLSRMIFFAPASLQHALRQFMAHYPYRAQSSGPRKPTSAANVRRCPTPSPCSTPTAPRPNAQLLPSGRSLTNVDSFFWTIRGAVALLIDAEEP
ncbi:MAG TPA: integrase core domain-containing protein, partial [Gemmatimonadaceae bacterium]